MVLASNHIISGIMYSLPVFIKKYIRDNTRPVHPAVDFTLSLTYYEHVV